jgi:hypothetical protein
LTNLAYAQPKFGTPRAANAPWPDKKAGAQAQSMMGMDHCYPAI